MRPEPVVITSFPGEAVDRVLKATGKLPNELVGRRSTVAQAVQLKLMSPHDFWKWVASWG